VVTRIEDPQDHRLLDYVGLTDMVLRTRVEPERGLYLAESEKVIRRALRAGHHPRSYLMGERWLTDLADLVEDAERSGVPVYVADAPVIEEMTGFHLHRGALASMHRPELSSPQALLAGARRVAVLEDVVDHTNVGAIFRNCAALGVDAVLVTPRCADPLYRRSVRVSMGTVLQVPFAPLPWLDEGISLLRDNGFRAIALTPTGELTLRELPPGGKVAIMVGAEGPGLTPHALRAADARVRIPMTSGVDSLNVATAAASAFAALCG